MSLKGADLLREDHIDCAGQHFFKTQCQRALDVTAFYRLRGQREGRRATGTIVVNVKNRNTVDIQAIERCLPGAAVAIHIATKGLFDQGKRESRVLQRCPCGTLAHHVVGIRLPRFSEGDHAHTGYHYL